MEVLKSADLIFCEDTRHSLKLLNANQIKKPLYACHKFNEAAAAERIADAAKEGKEVAVISDAGMPVISDPGNTVCQKLKEYGIPYTVVPGPNAALCALVLSAFDATRFTFIGFLPDKVGECRAVLETYKNLPCTLIFHVAPQDLDRQIAYMYEVLGQRQACAVREITKIHEECQYFLLSEGLAGKKRGEYVLLVEGAKTPANPLNDLPVREHVAHYMAQGLEKKEAVKRTAKDLGVEKQAVYKQTLDL